jgi:hypothetical protein
LAVAACELIVALVGFGTWQAVEAQIQTRRAVAKEAEIARLLDSVEKRDAATLPTTDLLEDVKKLRAAMERDLAPSGHPLTPQQQTLLHRGMKYLDKVQPYAARDPKLANEVAAAWKQVGIIFQPIDRKTALMAFNNAVVILNGSPIKDESQPPPVVNKDSPAQRRLPATGSAPLPHPFPPAPPALPAMASSAAPAVDPTAYEEFMTQLASAEAKSQVAEQTITELRANAQKLGHLLHPDIETQYLRMKMALEAARKAGAEGNLNSATENLSIARANAERVLKSGGR